VTAVDVTRDARDLLVELYRAALDGANIEALTASAVAAIPVERRRRVWLFAAGKAAGSMATAAIGTLQRELSEIAGGVVIAPGPVTLSTGAVASCVGDHPVPDRRSFDAAARIGAVIQQKRGADLGVVLLSGGTSSLIGAPLPGLSEADLSRLYDLLLRAGIDIHEMNAVRKRFARWAAGRLALALAPARTYCFAISDVPGDDVASIGSGPCVPDPTSIQQVIDILKRAELFSKIPTGLRQYVVDVARGVIPETPKASHPAFAHVTAQVIATNTVALKAAAAAARRAGTVPTVHERVLIGDAATAGAHIAESLLELRATAKLGTTACALWGGETTVRVPSAIPGGRCQELALSAAQRLARAGDAGAGITLLAAGTDGRDGNTEAAGAFVDAGTWAAISAAGRDPLADLSNHRAHDALASAQALFAPGPTGTNVMDVVLGVVRV